MSPAPTDTPAASELSEDEQLRIEDMLADADIPMILQALEDSPEYAGYYLDWTLGGMVVVMVTSESAKALVPVTPHPDRVTVRVVEHSLASLNELYERVVDAKSQETPGTADLREVGVKVSDNVLVVKFAKGSPSAADIEAGRPPEAYAREFGTFATRFEIDEDDVFMLDE